MELHPESRENYLLEWSDAIYNDLITHLRRDNMDDYNLALRVREGFCNGTDDMAVFGAEVAIQFVDWTIEVSGAGGCVRGKFNAAFIVVTTKAGADEADYNFASRTGDTEGIEVLAIFNALLSQGLQEAMKKVFAPAP